MHSVCAEDWRRGKSKGTCRQGDRASCRDEELVRLSTADMQCEFGYTVVEAASAEEALRLINGSLDVDVLVTDHLMPRMTGTELATTLREQRPSVGVLIRVPTSVHLIRG